ncbi:hypothetical protein ACSHWB_21820 [Lentzea sp. HUAS TT2]|uniref:hypothetical protein n=1 Tax=Lentzea sp. HUAS TT2 TaxID=3447454 RepID=UPI003F6FC825
MMQKRVFDALRNPQGRRSIEACITAAVTTALAVLSLMDDLVSDNVRWAAVLACLAVLVQHVTRPIRSEEAQNLPHTSQAVPTEPGDQR